VIVVNLKGGLGNQMFQYAFGLALAQKHGVPLKFDLRFLRDPTPRKNLIRRNYDLDIFSIPALQATAEDLDGVGLGLGNLVLQRWWLRIYASIPGQSRVLLERRFSFDENNLRVGPDAYLDGYWQSEKYFKTVEELVREQFTIKGAHTDEAGKLMRRIAGEQSVCVNVRRGDLVNDRRLGGLDAEYFRQAVQELANRIGSDFNCYIFSDDIEWCRQNLRFTQVRHFVGHEFAGPKFSTYLSLMRACKHFIIPNSTFAWWAAWLAENEQKIVIGPKRWFRDPAVDASDLIPENWLTV